MPTHTLDAQYLGRRRTRDDHAVRLGNLIGGAIRLAAPAYVMQTGRAC